MTAKQHGWTYTRYAALPDDGKRYEVLEGELVVNPSPNMPHQSVLAHLGAFLLTHVDNRGLGWVLFAPADVYFAEDTVVQPDILFVATDRAEIVRYAKVEGAPTLVVEVISRSTQARDRVRKADIYAKHGVPFYWIVDPKKRTAEAFRLVDGVYQAAGRVEGDASAKFPPFSELEIPFGRWWWSPPGA